MKRAPDDDALEEEETNGKNRPPRRQCHQRQRTLVGCGFVVPPRPPPTTDDEASTTVPVVVEACTLSSVPRRQPSNEASRPRHNETAVLCVTTWLVASLFVRLQFSVRCVRATASLVVNRRGCSSLAG
eukprot:1147860-Prorocentrum_minimum.AAC.1